MRSRIRPRRGGRKGGGSREGAASPSTAGAWCQQRLRHPRGRRARRRLNQAAPQPSAAAPSYRALARWLLLHSLAHGIDSSVRPGISAGPFLTMTKWRTEMWREMMQPRTPLRYRSPFLMPYPRQPCTPA